MFANAGLLDNIKELIGQDRAPGEVTWSHEWDLALPELGAFKGAGKRLGNKRLSQYQAIKVGPLADALEDIGVIRPAILTP